LAGFASESVYDINWFRHKRGMTNTQQSASRLDSERLKYLTENFNLLQGLSSVAFGIGYALFMMCDAYFGERPLGIVGVLLLLGGFKVSETYVPRYYARRFGCVKQSPKRIRWSRRQLIFGFVGIVVFFLVWILADFLLPSSVLGSRLTNSGVLAFGVSLLLSPFYSIPRRKGPNFVLGSAVTALVLAPIFYPLNESQLFAWKVVNAGAIGFCSIALGLWDHITLVRLYRRTALDYADE
jgi:hypothetical protein